MPWTVLPTRTEILAVHAALTSTGHILIVGGDQHDADLNDANDVFHTRLFHCSGLTLTTVPSPPFDAFCAGHAHLIDGRVLFAGGTDDFPPGTGEHHEHFPGLRDSAIWNPRSRSWAAASDMRPEPGRSTGGGRWYPTLLTLGDGKVLAISGHPLESDSRHTNDSPEAYSPSPRNLGTWRLLSGPDPGHASAYYPRGYVVPGGQVFFSTPIGGRTQSLRTEPYGWTDLGSPPPELDVYGGFGSSSVLLPLLPEDNYRSRVLIVGGTNTYLFDAANAGAGWQARGRGIATRPRRIHCQAVLLANGTVAVVGGVSDPRNDATAVRTVELYNPHDNSWSAGDTASVTRNYHSVAVLMPDGRVFTAGGNAGGRESFPSPGVDTRELRIELYAPPYHAASRPAITWAPPAVGWGEAFHVGTTQGDRIRRVSMIRAGSATHGWDSDQRFVGCVFRRAGDWLFVEAPPDSTIAPTGTYQLVTINDQGVPSPGRFIRLAPPARGSSALVQSNFGTPGNFELVAPRPRGGLNFYWRNNDAPGFPWSAPTAVVPGSSSVDSVPSMLQGNFGGNLEVVARIGDRLGFYWRGPSWNGPFLFGSPGVSGNPAMIQSLFGGRGNFELVVPLAVEGFAHYWRDNDAPGLPWRGPTVVGRGSGRVDAVAILQSKFGDPGNLEVLARYGNRLALWWRQSGPPWTWSGPQLFFTGAAGVPSMVQSKFGSRGNFEVVTPLDGGGAGHLWRNNDAAGFPWSGVTATIAAGQQVVAASLIESNFGTPGHGDNLEAVLRMGDGRNVHYWRGDVSPFLWSGGTTLP
ncbi:MAG TPA: galactose oxidase-like domain-containing protein [Acidimicrobiales bacterium]|nr:galactose oxidase-like domain-containing protein [Acidimicrobiales bacterium]